MKGRTVLVTGANGFIGRALTSRLAGEGAIVYALSRRGSDHAAAGVVPVATPLEELTADHWRRLGVGAFDSVFHLAAFTPKSRQDADDIDANFVSNLAGTRALLRSFDARPRRMVFTSTIDVYAPMPPDGVLNESSPVLASSVYAGSKICGERLALAWGAQSHVDTAILRYGHVYGPGEDAYQKLIPHTIRTVLAGQSPVIFGDGSAERDCVYVDDVVEATVRCALVERVPSHAVNIVSGVSHPVVEIVQRVIDATGASVTIDRRPALAADRSFRFDNRAMRDAFGGWPLVRLEEGLRAEVAHVRAER